MTLGDLLDLWRKEIDDVAQPYLWSDDEAIEYADDAQNEACRRGRLLVDSETTAVCNIALVDGTSSYALDSRVIRVNRAKVSGESSPLAFCMVRDLDERAPGWEDWSESTPTILVPDWQSGKIRLVATPDAAGTLTMTVVRLPLVELNDADQSFEIRTEYVRNLRHWLSYRAYMKRDSETYNPQKAADALALFEREFGKPQPAYDELWAQQYYGNGYGRY